MLRARCLVQLTCLGCCAARYHNFGSRHTSTYRCEVASPGAGAPPVSIPKTPLHHLARKSFTCVAQWHLTAPSAPGAKFAGLSYTRPDGQPRECVVLGQLGSGRQSRVESPQPVYLSFHRLLLSHFTSLCDLQSDWYLCLPPVPSLARTSPQNPAAQREQRMRAEDKERPAILAPLPASETMPCAHHRQLPCVFPPTHVGTRLDNPPPHPTSAQRYIVAETSRESGRPSGQHRRLAAKYCKQPNRSRINGPSRSSCPCHLLLGRNYE